MLTLNGVCYRGAPFLFVLFFEAENKPFDKTFLSQVSESIFYMYMTLITLHGRYKTWILFSEQEYELDGLWIGYWT